VLYDYNRFMYVRGNPLKYTDPSGHCAVLENGSRDGGDQACWDAADALYNLWKNETQLGRDAFWKRRFQNVDYDYFMQKIAPTPGADLNWMKMQQEAWRENFKRTHNLQQKVAWQEGQHPELRAPGSELVKTVVIDIAKCSNSVPDCGDALSDASTGLAGVAMGCSYLGLAPCAGVASGLSTATSAAGTVIAVYNAAQEPTTANIVDASVSATTTIAGATEVAARGNRSVGFGISLIQWLWDHRD
jgi:hypothetical protein